DESLELKFTTGTSGSVTTTPSTSSESETHPVEGFLLFLALFTGVILYIYFSKNKGNKGNKRFSIGGIKI
ncbi:hypothetical protein DRN58_03135, partial [Thermococci archaeon]